MKQKLSVFTLDLEDHRPDASYIKRYPQVTRHVLDFLEERNLRATVFVLGRLAREEPALIQEIDARGHEIAYHSATHVHLTHDTKANFLSQSMADVSYISELIRKPIYGYRAPAFSLTPKSLWVIDCLQQLGFKYSSSVMPVANPINGYPGAPREPFLWPNGLLEIPAPVATYGPLSLPFLGGIYLRYLPTRLIKYFLTHGDSAQAYWLYCHPHDFDNDERFFKIEGTSLIVSLLLWFNRAGTFRKLDNLLPRQILGSAGNCFKEKIDNGDYANAKVFAG